MTKSHCALEAHICPACLESHQTGAILLHRQLKKVFDREEITGVSFCPTCQQQVDKGYIVLVEISGIPASSDMKDLLAARTGGYGFIRKAAAANLFPDVPPDTDTLYVEESTMELLRGMMGD